jgi:REP element-mobilizing transposase RayT
MAHTYPDAQIHCVFSPRNRGDPFPKALREKISMYLIGIGHNQSLPILCAKASLHDVHLLIAVPRDVTVANAMQLLKGEFLTLAAETPIQFHLGRQLQPLQRKGIRDCSGQILLRSSPRRSGRVLLQM